MTGSAEVKAALAVARAMRRPAGSLMALLERAERAVRPEPSAGDLIDVDPTRVLAALLAGTTAEASRAAAVSRTRSPLLPSQPPSRTGRNGPPGAAVPAVFGPAGIVAASHDAPRLLAGTSPERTATAQTVKPAALGSLRDALRRAVATPLAPGTGPAVNADQEVAAGASRTQPIAGHQLHDTAGEKPALSSGTDPMWPANAAFRGWDADAATARRAEPVVGVAPETAIAVSESPGPGAADTTSSHDPDWSMPAAPHGLVGRTLPGDHDPRGTREGRSEIPDARSGTAIPANLDTSNPPARAGERHARPTGGSPRLARAATRPFRSLVSLDDEATALSEAAWRHGVDVSWP